MKGLNERQLEELKRDSITKKAMKETGLTFDEMMAVQLVVPSQDTPPDELFTLWPICWSGQLDPGHTRWLQKFAVLRWYISGEAGAPGNELLRQAAGMAADNARKDIAYQEKPSRETGLNNKAKTSQEAKKIIQDEAKAIWKNDTQNESRTGYVAKTLHKDVERLTGTQYAETTVAKWVREVAPDYASLPGAEKKS